MLWRIQERSQPGEYSGLTTICRASKTLRRLAFLFSESAGRADDATSAFIDRVMHNVMLRIRGNCANVVGIVNENGEECRQLAEHPDDRLEKLVDQDP
jgi:hypothetical protein